MPAALLGAGLPSEKLAVKFLLGNVTETLYVYLVPIWLFLDRSFGSVFLIHGITVISPGF